MSKVVYVLGELNVDFILAGQNIHPEPNKEKMIDRFEIVLGSSSAITACRLAGLGLKVFFVSVVGKDDFGKFCIEQLNRLGVDTTYVIQQEGEKTGITFSISTPTDRSLLTFMGTISKLAPGHIPVQLFAAADHIHFGSYFLQEQMRDHWISLFEQARRNQVSTSFDTGWDPAENWYKEQIDALLPYTDLFIPSEEEVKQIYRVEQVRQLPAVLPSNRGIAVIKQGAQGSTILTADDKFVESSAFDIVPVDTTGAGDSFNAGLIYAFLNGMEGKPMLQFANACGALSTQALGGAGGEIDLESIAQFMATHLQQ